MKLKLKLQNKVFEIYINGELANQESVSLEGDKESEFEVSGDPFTPDCEQTKNYIIPETSVLLYKAFARFFASLLKEGESIELQSLSFLNVRCPYCGVNYANYVVKLPHSFGATIYCERCFRKAKLLLRQEVV
jgi:hypothetical protein